jgi:hypothetical protein
MAQLLKLRHFAAISGPVDFRISRGIPSGYLRAFRHIKRAMWRAPLKLASR